MKKRFTILIAVGVVIMIALGVGAYFANQKIKSNLQNNLVNDFSNEETAIGNEVSTSVSDRFTGIENTLTATALDPSVQSLNPSVCNPAIQQYYKSVAIGVGNLGRVNPSGIFYCTINPKLLNKPASSLGTYIQQLFSDPHHSPVVSPEISVPGVTGYVVALHVPVYDPNHNFIGSIGGAVYLDQLSQQLFSKVKFAQTGFISVQDSNGDIIYSHSGKNIGKNYFSAAIQNQPGLNVTALNKAILAARQGQTQSVSYIGLGGVKKIASVVPVTIAANHRWIILVTVPQSEIANTYFSSGLNYAFNSVLGILLFTLVVIFIFLLFTTYSEYRLGKTKDEFISLASHQLRTPATGVKSFLGLLTEGYTGKLTDEQKHMIDKANESNERQLSIINDLLNTARLDSGRIKLELGTADLVALTRDVIAEQQSTIDQRQQHLDFQAPESLQATIDGDRMRMAVENLVSNASKYSPSGSTITVTLTQTSKWISVAVSDQGAGLSKADQGKLFKKFSRIQNKASVNVQGTGLGLYLTKQLIELHHGHITVNSEPGKGTTFTILLENKGEGHG